MYNQNSKHKKTSTSDDVESQQSLDQARIGYLEAFEAYLTSQEEYLASLTQGGKEAIGNGIEDQLSTELADAVEKKAQEIGCPTQELLEKIVEDNLRLYTRTTLGHKPQKM